MCRVDGEMEMNKIEDLRKKAVNPLRETKKRKEAEIGDETPKEGESSQKQ